jgi:hypothetical protein
MNKSLSWSAESAARPLSATLLHLAAHALRAASELLTRLAVRAADRAAPLPLPHVVEFHACHREGAAPEGALYVNGELVGYLPDVKRL